MTVAKVTLCAGCAASAFWIPYPSIKGSVVGASSFLAAEAIANHIHPRRWPQISVGAAFAAAGGALTFVQKEGIPFIAGVVVGACTSHWDGLWSRCYPGETR